MRMTFDPHDFDAGCSDYLNYIFFSTSSGNSSW